MRFPLFLLLLLSPLLLFSQRVNVWKFGNGAGLDFNTALPTALPNSGVNALEGTASVCDFSGSLLFFTNGNEARDRNNNLMPNGSGLTGGSSATQTLIVPRPGSCSEYFVFQASDHTQNGDIRYSVVDMCLNNGLGDVVAGSKNIFLNSNTSEKLTAVLHANGTDYWVITHNLNGGSFIIYPVTAAGIGAAVITAIGSFHPANCMIGPMKTSQNGQRLVVLNTFCSLVELFDFNPATGTLSNPLPLTGLLPNGGNGYYGAEFSPNNQLLYLSCTWINDFLVQLDLSTLVVTQLANTTGNYVYGPLQAGPNGKIYMVQNNQSAVDVINNPNVPGLGCNYVAASQPLAAGTTSTMGLPNFIPSQLNPIVPSAPLQVQLGPDTVIGCGQTVSLLLDAGSFCGANYTWQNGDTTQTVVITQPGTYWVMVNAQCGTGGDTIVVTGQVTAQPVVTLAAPAVVCNNQLVTLVASGASSYVWPPGQGLSATTGDSVTATPTVTTTYVVIGTDSCGAADTATVTVSIGTPGAAAFSVEETPCSLEIQVQDNSSGATSVLWDFGDGSTSTTNATGHTYTSAGVYTVMLIVNPASNCSDTALVQVDYEGREASSIWIPNSFTPNGDGLNETFVIAGNTDCFYDELLIFNRWGELIWQSQQPMVLFWDGRIDGQLVQEDTYVYRLTGRTAVRTGAVTVIR